MELCQHSCSSASTLPAVFHERRIAVIPFVRSIFEFSLVFRVRLDAQAGGEHELADGGGEAGEEGVEWLHAKINLLSVHVRKKLEMSPGGVHIRSYRLSHSIRTAVSPPPSGRP